MRRAELPRRLHPGVHRGALRQEPWGERDMMRTEVASGCGGGRKQTVAPCVGVEGTDYTLGDKEMRSVQGVGIQTGGWLACIDEVSQDLEDLRGVGDDGDNLHGFVTTRAAQRIGFVDLLDQAGPCGAAVLGRHRELGLRDQVPRAREEYNP